MCGAGRVNTIFMIYWYFKLTSEAAIQNVLQYNYFEKFCTICIKIPAMDSLLAKDVGYRAAVLLKKDFIMGDFPWILQNVSE